MAFSPTSCPSCGAANRAQSAFCRHCGKPLTGGGLPGKASSRTTLAPTPGKTPVAALPFIEVSTNTQRTSYSLRPDKQEINIGRDPSNDIVIDAPVVSHFHAQIVRKGNQ